jgi:stress response protein SCP2
MNIQHGQRLKLTDCIGEATTFSLTAIINAPMLKVAFACFGLTATDQLPNQQYLCFDGQTTTPCGGVLAQHFTGNAANFVIDLHKLPATIVRLVITAAIDGEETMAQMSNSVVSLNAANSKPVTYFFAGKDFVAEKAVMLFEVYRKEGSWRLTALGYGFNGGLAALVKHFGGKVAQPSSVLGIPAPAQLEAAPPFPSVNRFWQPLGNRLTVAATLVIDGSWLYVGSGLKRLGSGLPEPALIDPKLPIGDMASADYRRRPLSYWSSYSEAPPEDRAAYLNWLADGRKDPAADMSYVLLYFYGLERRVLADAKTKAAAQAELPILIEEVERLQGIYRHSLFPSYATELLAMLKSICAEAGVSKQYLSDPSTITNANTWYTELPLLLKIALGQLAIDKEPVPAEWAYAWLVCDPRINLGVAANRCATEFKQLFLSKYRETYGKGMGLAVNKTKIKAHYQATSPTFSQRFISRQLNLPDVSALTSRVNSLQTLANACKQTLNGYSRFLGRYPELAGSADALLELPFPLWAEGHQQPLQTIKQTLEATKTPVAVDFTKLKTWLPDWQTPTKSKLILLALRLSEAGLGMEPDPRFGGDLASTEGKVVLFLKIGNGQSPSSQYLSAALALRIACALAAVDAQVSPAARSVLHGQIDAWRQLQASEKQRLHAHLCWLLTKTHDFKSTQKYLKQFPETGQTFLLECLLQTATADLPVSTDKIKLLEKIYKLLKQDVQSLYGKLHANTADDLVTVRPAQPLTAGFALPKPPVPEIGLQLDMARITALKQESQHVTDKLTELYEQDVAASGTLSGTPLSVTETPEPPADTLWGLDVAHSALLGWLCTRAEWPRPELESIAAERGMMLDGALEQLNEAAYDHFDEALIEGDDPIYMNQEIVKTLCK